MARGRCLVFCAFFFQRNVDSVRQGEKYRLGFGSCVSQYRSSAALVAAGDMDLDGFVFLGDNGYHDTPSCGISWNPEPCSCMDWLYMCKRLLISLYRRIVYKAKIEDSMRREDDYRALWKKHLKKFVKKNKDAQIFATYDDHDYGQNDIGADYEYKQDAKEQFISFWQDLIPKNTSFEMHDDGVYTDTLLSFATYKMHLILLDTRYSRTPWKPATLLYTVKKSILLAKYFFLHLFFRRSSIQALHRAEIMCLPQASKGFIHKEPKMLSETQWKWLQTRLDQEYDSDFIIIASSIQVLRINTHDAAESWGLIPKERQRLLNMLHRTTRFKQKQILILSGDVHYAEFSQILPTGIIEATSSGLTEAWPCAHFNQLRLHPPFHQTNFGLMDLYPNGTVHLQIRNSSKSIVRQHFFSLFNYDDHNRCIASSSSLNEAHAFNTQDCSR